MGAQLVMYFKQAEEKAGLLGKTRMAIKTAIPSAQASEVPDTPELLQKAREALAEL